MKRNLKIILFFLVILIYIFLVINSNVNYNDTTRLIYSNIPMPYWLLYTFGFIIIIFISYIELLDTKEK